MVKRMEIVEYGLIISFSRNNEVSYIAVDHLRCASAVTITEDMYDMHDTMLTAEEYRNMITALLNKDVESIRAIFREKGHELPDIVDKRLVSNITALITMKIDRKNLVEVETSLMKDSVAIEFQRRLKVMGPINKDATRKIVEVEVASPELKDTIRGFVLKFFRGEKTPDFSLINKNKTLKTIKETIDDIFMRRKIKRVVKEDELLSIIRDIHKKLLEIGIPQKIKVYEAFGKRYIYQAIIL